MINMFTSNNYELILILSPQQKHNLKQKQQLKKKNKNKKQ